MAGVTTGPGLPARTNAVLGRGAELQVLDAFIDSLERRPAMLVLEGEPGLGKTTLWRETLRAAQRRSCRVLECRPVQAEAQLAFTALSDLLSEVPDSILDELAAPQRRALDVALLRAEPNDDELFPRAVALGFLGVLVALARSAPLVVGVDDFHWMDHASRTALAFAARRVRTERIGILLARRVDHEPGFPNDTDVDAAMTTVRLQLSALDDVDLERLLHTELGGQLDRRATARVCRIAGGNPLLAIQLGRALLEGDADDSGGGPGLLIPASLQHVVGDRLRALGSAALDVVRVAAAVARPSTELIESVLSTGRTREGLSEAIAAGVLAVDRDKLGFTHPLLATAAYSQMTVLDRRALHGRVAELVDDIEERGRHLAAAAERPDERIAEVLEAAAGRARARYAPDAAAELWEAAARLTPAEEALRAGQRRLHAADCLFESGEVTRARQVLEDLAGVTPPGPTRTRALVRLGWVVSHIEGFEAGAVRFRVALDEIGDDVAAEVEVEQGLAWCLHESSGLTAAEPHARRALALAEALGDARLVASARSHVELIESMTGRGLAVETVGQIALTADASWPEILVRPAWIHGMLLAWNDQLVMARERFAALRREAADRGDEHSLPFMLFQLSRTELLLGEWTQAQQTARECAETTRTSGQSSERPFACDIESLVAAHLGSVDSALALISSGLELADRFGVIPARFELLATRGFLELSLGRNDDADHTLSALAADAEQARMLEPALFRYHGDAIEAKIALGRIDDAAVLIERLEQLAARLQRPWLTLIAGRGRGLLLASLGQLDEACHLLAASLAGDRAGQPFEHARTLLAYGSVQRRHRQKRGARAALVDARATFAQLGAGLWVAKADAELSRVGGRAPSDGLTPTELQIAELIAAGRTYREVASELFISPKTVQWNLSKVYRKLDIRSRSELPGRLEGH